MPFTYVPPPANRSGLLLGAGIASAGRDLGAGLADAIAQHKRNAQELTGYQAVLKALSADPQNGIDPDSIDKMTLGQAKGTILGAEIKRQQAAQRQQQQTTAAGLALPGQIMSNLQPSVNAQPRPIGAPAGDVTSAATGADVSTQPGMNPLMAQLSALSQNPRAVMSPQGQEVFKNMLKTMNTVNRTPQPFDMNGVRGVVDPVSGRVTQPARTAGAGTGGRPNAASELDPDEDLVPYTPPGGKEAIPGLYKRMKGGKATGFWQDPQAQPRAAAAKRNVFDLFGDTPSGGAPAGGTAPKRVRVVGPNREHGTVEEGDELPEGWKLSE